MELLLIALLLIVLFLAGGIWVAKWIFILALVVFIVWLIMEMSRRRRV